MVEGWNVNYALINKNAQTPKNALAAPHLQTAPFIFIDITRVVT
jgi:hypothetical protein